MWRWLIELIVAALVLVGVYQWQMRDMLVTDGSHVVQPVRLFSVNGTTEELFVGGSNGGYTLVYFFATWCSICKLSIASINGFDDESFSVLAIALDYESPDSVKLFVEEQDIRVPSFLVTAASSKPLR